MSTKRLALYMLVQHNWGQKLMDPGKKTEIKGKWAKLSQQLKMKSSLYLSESCQY